MTRLLRRWPNLSSCVVGAGLLLAASAAHGDDLVVDRDMLIDSDLTVDGSVFIENGATLTLRSATLTLQLDFDEEHHVEIEAGSRLVIENGIVNSTGGQFWLEMSGQETGPPPVLEVSGAGSWLTNHSGIRPFGNAQITVTGGDVEELQVRDQTTVVLTDGATYPVFFFDGVTANISDLDTGPSITNIISVPGGWSFSLTRANVEGYQIDLLNGASVDLDSGDGIVVSIHTPGNLGDQLRIVDGVTAAEPINGSITNLGSSFTFTDSNIALINVYTFGNDRVLLRDSHVNEVNAEQRSELIIGQKGYSTTLNCNLCQVYDNATFTVVEATIDASDNLPSATSSYASFEPVGRGEMTFVNMDLRALDLTAREQGVLNLFNTLVDPGRLDVEDASAQVVEADLAAGFTASRLSGSAPLTVDFLDQSAGPVSSFSWDFGDGSTSSAPEPFHVFSSPGSYTVRQTVSGAGDQDTLTKTGYIQVTGAAGGGDCVPGSQNLCLSQGRFQVEVTWRDFTGSTGSASVVPFGSDDSGLFWFFAPDNWEMLVKVIRGCDLNDHYWVFAAATTNVEYTLKVTDTEYGKVETWHNPLGVSASAITDTSAFATCP